MTTHNPPGQIELRCRHLALQSVVETVCMDCGEFVEAHDQITG
jgi:hypothetical protein